MIWLGALVLVLLPIAVWIVVARDDEALRRRLPPMGWLRRLWARPTPDRRHCYRYRAEIPLTYRVLTANTPPLASRTRDISFGGVGLILYEKLPPGTPLEISLRCAPPAGPMTVQGRVQWVREVASQAGDPKRLFWAGIEILHTGTVSLDRLRAALQQISPDGRQGRR